MAGLQITAVTKIPLDINQQLAYYINNANLPNSAR